MKPLSEIYISFLISSFGKIEMTKLSQVVGENYTHDTFTKKLLLDDEIETDKELWRSVKPILRKYENEVDGCLLIDDSLLAKPYSKNNEVICWHYDHVSHRNKKGILMLNFHYTDASGISLPLGYEIVTKTEDVYDNKKKQWLKRSMFTKNEIMRDKLKILHFYNKLKYRYILFDKWFASIENMVFINDILKKKFVCPVKKNRKVALSEEDRNNGNYVNIADVDIEDCSSRLIYLEGYEDALKVTKQVSKDGNDDESIYLYLVTNDIDLTTNKILEIYKRRWKIEEYHKSLKQNLKIEHSPTKVETSQLNHVYLCVCGFIRLEQMRLYEGLNHFAIKERIYIQALSSAFQEVEKLKYA
jgi:hypothetical protein